MACVAFRLFLWRVSPSGCFHSVCRLYRAVFTACVAFQLVISGVCRFHSSLIVSFIFCSPFSVHGVGRLQLVFKAVPPSRWFHDVCRLKVTGISSFRRFQTSLYNVLCPHFFFLFSSRVSLLSFLSLCSAYAFQAGLFMVFSAPNLVFVVCVTFSLVLSIWHLLLLFMVVFTLGCLVRLKSR